MTEKPEPRANKPHPVEIVFDDETLTVPDKDTTPNALLELAGLDPAQHYVVELQGRNRISFKDRGTEPIKVHDGQQLVSVSTQPTPTS